MGFPFSALPAETKRSPLCFFSALRLFKKKIRVLQKRILRHVEIFLLFLSLRYGADLDRSQLVNTRFKGTVKSENMLVCNGNDGPVFKGAILCLNEIQSYE